MSSILRLTKEEAFSKGFIAEGSKIVEYRFIGKFFIDVPHYINGVLITSIGNSVFKDLKLEEVVLPDSIIEIGVDAFALNKLKELNLPTSLQRIGSGAFFGNLLKSIILTETIEEIGDHAFAYNKLNSVTHPTEFESNIDNTLAKEVASSINYGVNPFKGNPDVKFISTFAPTEERVAFNFITNETGKELVSGNSTGIIPKGVIIVRKDTLGAMTLKTISVPDSISFIHPTALGDQNLLTTLNLFKEASNN